MLGESPEHMVVEHLRTLSIDDLDDLVLDVADYSVFHDDTATVVLAPRGILGGIVVWNLERGPENDYHIHPESEHLTFVVDGELEFILGNRIPSPSVRGSSS
jgi:quercetin dioxygenase-like cupin family protein